MTLRPLIAPVAVLAVLAIACAHTPVDTVLEPVARPFRLDATPFSTCGVDDELRPSLGCVPSLAIATETHVEHSDPVLQRRYRVPASLGAGVYVLQPMVRSGERAPWVTLPPSVARLEAGADIDVAFPLPAGTPEEPIDLGVRGRPVPPETQRAESEAVQIERGAVLRLGIAVDPAGDPQKAMPVDFRLAVATPNGEQELLRSTLDPADGSTRGWHDQRIDLSGLTGTSVRFVATTRLVAHEGRTGDGGFGFPLWGAPEILAPRPRRGRPNLLLISLDTLRADHLGTYGCDLPTSPVIDRFASEGTLFEQVLAAYPSTPASHMTMMTGTYPGVHRLLGPLDRLGPDIPTLAELLARDGYATAAVTEDGMLVAAAGFQRGFSSYRENKGATIWDASGQVDVTFPAGLRWLEAHRGERFFLFLHTYQVHEPYSPPPEFDVFRTYREDGKDVPITAETPLAIRSRHLYAGEVRYVDSEFAKLMDGLRALGEADRTVVVVTSDHGEEFFEHGWKGHDESLYEEVLRVPLVLHAPGLVPTGLRIPVQVSLADLTPTLLDLLGAAASPAAQGTSLVPLLKDPTAAAFAKRAAFAELTKKRQPYLTGVRAGGFMWIFPDVPGRAPEVYDLRKDPGERENVATPALLAEGETLIGEYRTAAAAAQSRLAQHTGSVEAAPPSLDDRTVEKLRALGYVQ